MKKVLLIIMICFFVLGCSHKKMDDIEKEDLKEIEIVEKEEEYVDDNIMPIALYHEKTNNLSKVTDYSILFKKGTDIGLFQIYPSEEENISLQENFGMSFYKTWNAIDQNKTYKIGFHLSYELEDGTKISHYVYNPSTTMLNKKYIKIYLYDDYAHRNDSWYSHIEKEEYSQDSYLTSIKLTPGSDIQKVSSSIVFTVFTYNGEDDFNKNGDYRGISKYSITIDNKK